MYFPRDTKFSCFELSIEKKIFRYKEKNMATRKKSQIAEEKVAINDNKFFLIT